MHDIFSDFTVMNVSLFLQPRNHESTAPSPDVQREVPLTDAHICENKSCPTPTDFIKYFFSISFGLVVEQPLYIESLFAPDIYNKCYADPHAPPRTYILSGQRSFSGSQRPCIASQSSWQEEADCFHVSIYECGKVVAEITYLAPKHQPNSLLLIFLAVNSSRSMGMS